MQDAKHWGPTQQGPYCVYHGRVRSPESIDWVVIHDAEGGSAQGVAAYGASGSAKASWHYTCDDKIGIRCLGDDVIAYHAYSPANEIGLGLELCGYASWSKAQWYLHQSTLKRGAWQVARWCVKYSIPPRWLSDSGIRNKQPGILCHADVTRVLGKGSHSDPGPNFPRKYFMWLVQRRVNWLTAGT